MSEISVIIPTYNRANKIERCINSITNQITQDDEIIIIDDCSIDNTYELLQTIKNKHNNVIVRKNSSNKGVSYSRNIGLNIAKGKFILFVDSDDTLKEASIREYIEIYNKENPDVICSGITYKNENDFNEREIKVGVEGKTTEKKDMQYKTLQYEINGLMYSSCNKMYLKNIIDKYNIRFNEKTSNLEDYEFNCDYFKHCNSIYFLDKSLYYYMISNEKSLSARYIPDLLERYKIIKEKRNTLYSIIRKEKETKEQLDILNFEYLFNCVNNLYREECTIKTKDRIKKLNEILNQENFKLYNTKKCNNRYTKLMAKILKINNAYIIEIILKILHSTKKKFKKTYVKLVRQKLVEGKE